MIFKKIQHSEWTLERLPFSLALLWLILLVSVSFVVRWDAKMMFEVMDVNHVYKPPSLQFWMGTDSLGRSYFLRVLKGSGVSLLIAFLASILSLLIALVFGGLAGWFSKGFDLVFSVILNVWMSLPTVVLASLVALVFLEKNESLLLVSTMIGVTHWGRMARIIRNEIVRLKEKEFMAAAQLLGGGRLHLIRKHLIPHLKIVMGVTAVYQLPSLILSESFMSFIGLGIQPPETSWGLLLQEGWRNLHIYPHMVFFPAFFLFLTILSLNQLSKSLERHSRNSSASQN